MAVVGVLVGWCQWYDGVGVVSSDQLLLLLTMRLLLEAEGGCGLQKDGNGRVVGSGMMIPTNEQQK